MALRQRPGILGREKGALRRRARRPAFLLVLLGLAAVSATLGLRPRAARAGAQCGPPLVSVTASPPTVAPGQAVTITYTAVAGNGCSMATAPLPTLLISFGDNTAPQPLTNVPSGSINHSYSSPGSYVVTVTAASGGQTGVGQASVTVTSGPPPSPPSSPGITITYPVGWNLIGLPPGSMLPGPLGPLYTYQPGDTAYEVVQNTQPGLGYWAYLSTAVSVSLPFTGPQVITRSLPAGQFVMVGNPGGAAAIVTGADIVYTYDPVTGYQLTDQIPPGQGAWVFSFRGGTVTITSGIR